MPYNVKIKDRSGTEKTYSGLEQIALPLASGNENAIFLASYSVSLTPATDLTYTGGDKATYNTDYCCRISTGTSGKNVPTTIIVKIDDAAVTSGTEYVYSKISDTESFVRVIGAYITGNLIITVAPVTP